MKPDDAGLGTISIFLDGVDWRLLFVNKVWVENIELVALHYFWGRIVMIIMCLVVFIPLISRVHAVKVLRLSRPVLIMPPVHLCKIMLDRRNSKNIKIAQLNKSAVN